MYFSFWTLKFRGGEDKVPSAPLWRRLCLWSQVTITYLPFLLNFYPSFQIGFVSCMSMPEILLRFSFCQEVIVHIIISGISRWLRKPTLASCLCIFNWGEKQNLDWKCSVAGHFAYSRVWISSDFLHLTWFNRVRGSNKCFLVLQFHVQKTLNFSNPIMINFLFIRTTRLDLEFMIFH